MQVLHHFIRGTWASLDFGILGGSWNQFSTDTKGQLYTEDNGVRLSRQEHSKKTPDSDAVSLSSDTYLRILRSVRFPFNCG